MRLAQRSARSIGDSTSTVHPSVAAFREGVPEKKASLTSLESLSGRTTTTCSPVSFRLIFGVGVGNAGIFVLPVCRLLTGNNPEFLTGNGNLLGQHAQPIEDRP